jgi:hypothetical protein
VVFTPKLQVRFFLSCLLLLLHRHFPYPALRVNAQVYKPLRVVVPTQPYPVLRNVCTVGKGKSCLFRQVFLSGRHAVVAATHFMHLRHFWAERAS